MDTAFLNERIAATKLQIAAYEDASTALGTGGAQSYTLDTGQSRQTVTRPDLEWIHKTIDGLYNRLVTLQTRLDGRGVLIARPSW